VIGIFETLLGVSPVDTNYVQWKGGWLQHRTDKIVGVNGEDAKTIIAGFKGI
jgi:hypothetical protein